MSEYYELTYGDVLKELRNYHGYKQREISDYLNITSQAYSNYENNKRTPDIEILYKIARFYHITLDTLVNYRFTKQLEDARTYAVPKTLYRGVSDSGVSIPLTAKQAKMVTDILSLPEEQQDACHQFANFMKRPAF